MRAIGRHLDKEQCNAIAGRLPAEDLPLIWQCGGLVYFDLETRERALSPAEARAIGEAFIASADEAAEEARKA
jgi:hypothetical protein